MPFATHLTYSLHFHAFMLILISCSLLFAWLDTLVLAAAGIFLGYRFLLLLFTLYTT